VQIYTEDTLRLIHHRNDKNKQFNDYLLPAKKEFIPPRGEYGLFICCIQLAKYLSNITYTIGKSYFDPEFIAEQENLKKKAKVNIALVKDRDHELREITSFIYNKLVSSLLQQTSISDRVQCTLTNTILHEVPLCKKFTVDGGMQLSKPQLKYGVYLQDVKPVVPLHRQFIEELTYMGILRDELSNGDDDVGSNSETVDATNNNSTIKFRQLRTVLETWKLIKDPDYVKAMQTIEQMA
jgi:hypothetical protein